MWRPINANSRTIAEKERWSSFLRIPFKEDLSDFHTSTLRDLPRWYIHRLPQAWTASAPSTPGHSLRNTRTFATTGQTQKFALTSTSCFYIRVRWKPAKSYFSCSRTVSTNESIYNAWWDRDQALGSRKCSRKRQQLVPVPEEEILPVHTLPVYNLPDCTPTHSVMGENQSVYCEVWPRKSFTKMM